MCSSCSAGARAAPLARGGTKPAALPCVRTDPTPREPTCIDTGDHSLTLLPTSRSSLSSIEHDIAQASRRVWIESFIVRDDQLGGRLLTWLAGARQRGVDTRLLYDPLGSRTTSRAFFERCRACGIDVRAYRPWTLPLRGSARWPRNHARLFCIDDVAYVGGVAFGDEWLPRDQGGRGWHDVCCRVRGPLVDVLGSCFERRWEGAQRDDHPQNTWSNDYADVALMADAPADQQGIYALYRERVRRARARVWIENGYFFPPRRLWQDLRAAARRGVDVKVIVPAGSDVPVIASAARGEYGRWLRAGLEVHEYQPAMCHSKFAVIDDDWATIGSFNLNPTSLISTNETNLFIYEPRMVAVVAALFEADLSRCRAITRAALRERSLMETLKCALLRGAMRGLETTAWLLVGTAKRLQAAVL